LLTVDQSTTSLTVIWFVVNCPVSSYDHQIKIHNSILYLFTFLFVNIRFPPKFDTMMIERRKMTRATYQALKRYILLEREKKKQGD